MKTILSGLAAVALACGAANDRVLLVGVGKYPPAIPSLPGIDKDLSMMYRNAVRLGFPEGNIHMLMDAQATKAAVDREIQDWLIAGGPKGRVLIYYSGHGTLVEPARRGEPRRPALVNYDFDFDQPSKQLIGSELGRMIERIPSQKVLLVIDACNSGQTTDPKSLRSDDIVPKYYRFPGDDGRGDLAAGMMDLTSKGGSAATNHLVLAACQRSEFAGASSRGSLLTVGIDEAFDRLGSTEVKMEAVRDIADQRIQQRHREMEASGKKANPQTPVLSGNLTLKDMDWRDQALPAAPVFPKLREVLDKIVKDAQFAVPLQLDPVYRADSLLSVTVTVPEEGYLTMISLSEGDADGYFLYPNRWVVNNKVGPGRVVIPGAVQSKDPSKPYRIRQALPVGMSRQRVLIYAIVTKRPLAETRKSVEDVAFQLIPSSKGPQLEEETNQGHERIGASRREYVIER